MFKSSHIGLFFILFILTLVTACNGLQQLSSVDAPGAPTPAQATELNICLSGSTSNAVLVAAEQSGLFEKHGLSANLVTVNSGSNAANALIAGDVDLCLMGTWSFVNAAVVGEDLVLTAGTINQMFFALVVSPEIESAQDLVGKTLGSSGPGNTSDTFLRMALLFSGLDPDQDVTLVNIGRSSDRIAAMEAGRTAGTAVVIPDVAAAERLGFRTLISAAEMGIPYQHNGIVTTREFIENNNEAMTGFTKVLVEAIALMKQDRTKAVAALAETLKLDLVDDAEYLDEIYDSFVQDYLAQIPYPSEEGLQVVIDESRANNPDALDVEVKDIIDRRFVAALEEEGFIDNLYQEE